jgi:hypothetical protein
MDIPATITAAFPPSPDLVLDHVRRHLDDAMLMWIARADYGHMAEEMLTELRFIRDKGIMPAPMHWQLSEVLELTRWCNPEVPNPPPFEPGPTGRRGHQARLFACAVLLRADAEPASRYQDNAADSTLAQCLTSAHVLGEELSEAAARFLTWRIPRMEACSQPVLFALGLLILVTRLRSGRIPDRVLGTLAELVLAEESLYRQAFPLDFANPMPLAFSLQCGCWQSLAAELRAKAAAIAVDEVRTNLQLCALLLKPGGAG